MNEHEQMNGEPMSRDTDTDNLNTNEDTMNNAENASNTSPTSQPTPPEQETYASPDFEGQRYVNPDGSHGFVYNNAPVADRKPPYRGILIAISVMLVTVLAVGGAFVGAWMAAKNLVSPERDTVGSSSGEVGTSGGLYIENDTEETGEEQSDETHEASQSLDSVTPSIKATIIKKSPKRQDTNKDGKPDVAYGADGQVLTSAGDAGMSVATVVAKVAASVVEITTETTVQSGFIGQYVTSGAGSGVIIAEEGYIVTNHHVIDGANSITVRTSDGREFSATLVGSDQETDIAVLWIDAGNYPLTVATIGASYDLVVGEDILAIGNPLGSLGGTVTEGMISATARDISVSGTVMTLLQISAPINPGNSGGGLFNLAGELVGVVNAKMASEEIEGLGFAIPSDTAYTVICELIEHGYVRSRPALGVTLTEVVTMSGDRYVRVNDKNHAVLKDRDLILTADGVRISSMEELANIVRKKSVGDTITMTVQRDGRQIRVQVPVIERSSVD